MLIGTFEKYKNFDGTIECEDRRMFGRLYRTKKEIKYEVLGDNNSDNLIKLYKEYQKAVDNYIDELIAIEMAKPQLKIEIRWSLYTDGDYSLMNHEKYDSIHNDEEYSGTKTFIMSEDKGCRREAISFLERLLCDIHYGYTHYYIMKSMYNMFENSMNFISNKDNYGFHYEYMGGNYDGTEINITITRVDIEEENK